MESNFLNADLEDSSWQINVQKNLSILTKSLNDLDGVLIKLLEHNLISRNEFQTIRQQGTNEYKNLELLFTLKTKGWSRIKPTFMQILKETNQDYCVDIIESSSKQQTAHCSSQSQPKHEKDIGSNETSINRLLKSKWWPEIKILPNSFYERKTDKKLFTHKLKRLLTQRENKNKTTVINQKVAVSGLGGVGKSTTAKWFGHKYENDYEFILWIDCGEKSLTTSFTNLARDLNVKDRKELELKELARGCFDILEKRNCLLIYDNAECYVGDEGIRDVLPKNNDNFHIIITSRNREWGNDTGYGKIPELQLDVFEKSEALDFMSQNVYPLVNKDESQLGKICELLGNLPLALQIAVAAVNRSQISLPQYIQILKNTEEILVTTFDDYEKTINRTMQTSLNIIRNSEKDIGGLAYQILFIFGFISPDDIQLEFFKSIKKEKTRSEIYTAGKLLASYSLVTHNTRITESNILEDIFSIHRLLQQVIRLSSAESKTEILKTILNCEGFLENKLIPYSYADKELQDEFPEIKAELIQKLQLKKLLSENKFEDAKELSRIIKDTLKDLTSHYNYALCLKYNTEIELAIVKFKKFLMKERQYVGSKQKCCFSQFGILERSSQLPLALVGGQLLDLYFRQKNDAEAKQLFTTLQKISFPYIDIHEISSTLNWIWNIKSNGSYRFNYYGDEKCLEIRKECKNPINKMQLSNCVLNENFQLKNLPKDLEELSLIRVELLSEEDKCTAKKLFLTETDFVKSIQVAIVVEMTINRSKVNIDILPESLQMLNLEECFLVVDSLCPSNSDQPPLPNLQELTLRRIQTFGDSHTHINPINISRLLSPKLVLIEVSHYWNKTRKPTFSNVPFNCLQLIKHLSLDSCKLVHTGGICIAPQSLKLVNVQIIDGNAHYLSDKLLNDFIDLKHIQSLHLHLNSLPFHLSSSLSIDTVVLEGTKNVNWKKSRSYINNLDLHNVDVVDRTKMTIKKMSIIGSLVDISQLPHSLEILHLSGSTLVATNFIFADDNQIPFLKKLILFEVKLKNAFVNTDEVIAAPLRVPCYLNELIIICSDFTRLTIHLFDLVCIPKLYLQKCNLIYAGANVLNPKSLVLKNVNVIEERTKNVLNIPVNEFVCFTQLEVLKLEGMSIDFATSVTVTNVFLLNAMLKNWKHGKWCIDNLHIWPHHGRTTMKIKKLEIENEFFI